VGKQNGQHLKHHQLDTKHERQLFSIDTNTANTSTVNKETANVYTNIINPSSDKTHINPNPAHPTQVASTASPLASSLQGTGTSVTGLQGAPSTQQNDISTSRQQREPMRPSTAGKSSHPLYQKILKNYYQTVVVNSLLCLLTNQQGDYIGATKRSPKTTQAYQQHLHTTSILSFHYSFPY
jgi:hypothetical protein